MLFQLLNEMDGLAEDADVIFVLTTNRVQLLEGALAARPGRIDQAVEIRLPDAECRHRLVDRYLQGVSSQLGDGALDELVARTDGREPGVHPGAGAAGDTRRRRGRAILRWSRASCSTTR